MEVLVGPTFSIGGDVSSTGSTYVVAPASAREAPGGCGAAVLVPERCSSSIGAPDDSDEDDDDDDEVDEEGGVVSSKKNNVLGSMNSLEDALPYQEGIIKSFLSWSNPKSMPLLALHEDDDGDEDHSKGFGGAQGEDNKQNPSLTQGIIARKLLEKRFPSFGLKSQSCFTLSDLQEEEEEDDDDDEK
ncbi:hypothetical protein OIU74_025412 [Salix koriyanagi]|uniref:Uncharacterized protein n=1 Tax=Salix koriyanagi TaxID=2511006 RepID=A0A9Q0W160_9ROSI|nr:hypothetical protein OIU74_025412 [Salix koriyanagi]